MPARRRTDHPESADESPLRRWSRRKQAAREPSAGMSHEAPETAPALPPEAPADAPASAEADTTDADRDPPTDADLPPIESLDANSDYSQFMSPRVSQSLRRMALRKLFGTASFNVRDGLDDYDEDYTRYQSLGDTVTADMRYHAERRARLAADEDEDAATPENATEPAAIEPDPSVADNGERASEVSSTDHEQEADDDRG